MPDRPSVATVIVSYNVRDDLDACLASLSCARADTYSLRITIVDNGSSDGTLDMLRARWPFVKVIAADENLGFGRANNLGAARTAGDYILLLNPDTLVPPDAIGTLLKALAAEPSAAAAGPKLLDRDLRPELSFGWPVSLAGEWRQRRLMRAYSRGESWASTRVDDWTRRPGPRDWLSAACLLVRREDFEAAGGFDERFFMYYEDVDLCVRLRQRGRLVLFEPGATVRHMRGRSGRHNPSLARRRRESQLAYYAKHHPLSVPLLRGYQRLCGD